MLNSVQLSWKLTELGKRRTADHRRTSTRVVHRCVRTNISAIPDIFGEMNEIFIKHAMIFLR